MFDNIKTTMLLYRQLGGVKMTYNGKIKKLEKVLEWFEEFMADLEAEEDDIPEEEADILEEVKEHLTEAVESFKQLAD